MEILTGKELLWLFFVYSFGGWVLETITATIKNKKFVNRGLINGPFCVIYGFTAVLLTVTLQELTGFALFLFAAVYATVAEWVSGHFIEKIYKERWWDYSEVKWNIGGYVCLPMSILWGILGYVAVRFVNSFLLLVFRKVSAPVVTVFIWVIGIALFIDILADIILLLSKKNAKKIARWENANHLFGRISAKLSGWIAGCVHRRMKRAYPNATAAVTEEVNTKVFAYGCCFYKIAILFLVGAFLGDITETIFCRITTGIWMSRSSVIWGPFSIVWGLAIAMATAMLYKYKDKSDSFLFITGTLLGGAYEYLCSVFTEIVFGKVFWDYSKIPFNLGGRINLLYCFFWGIAAVVWFKKIYPVCSKWIEKIPMRPGKIGTWMMLLFMVVNILASSAALTRYEAREQGIEAKNQIEQWMDVHYDDARMKQIYPNAIQAK